MILHTASGLHVPIGEPAGPARCTIYALHGGGLTLESFWGPMALYPPATFTPAGRVTTPTTERDGIAAQTWSESFHAVARQVRVPVRVTMVDHEAWWGDVPSTLIDVAAGFTSSVSVQTNVELAAGHNVSVGLSARSYHLGVLAFVEQCLRRAQLTGSDVEPS